MPLCVRARACARVRVALCVSLRTIYIGRCRYLLMMVWEYPLSFGDMIECFILSSNVVALRAYFHPDGNVASTAFVVSVGWLTRRTAGWLLGLMCLNTSACSFLSALV